MNPKVLSVLIAQLRYQYKNIHEQSEELNLDYAY